MKVSIVNEEVNNVTGYSIGDEGFFANQENPCLFIGEDDSYAWVFLTKTKELYGVLKQFKNLSCLHLNS